ncbi:MAG: hypothetical protein PVJ92_01440 [Candidatus Dependentiae bacterium]|jgi:hypothetical protein
MKNQFTSFCCVALLALTGCATKQESSLGDRLQLPLGVMDAVEEHDTAKIGYRLLSDDEVASLFVNTAELNQRYYIHQLHVGNKQSSSGLYYIKILNDGIPSIKAVSSYIGDKGTVAKTTEAPLNFLARLYSGAPQSAIKSYPHQVARKYVLVKREAWEPQGSLPSVSSLANKPQSKFVFTPRSDGTALCVRLVDGSTQREIVFDSN